MRCQRFHGILSKLVLVSLAMTLLFPIGVLAESDPGDPLGDDMPDEQNTYVVNSTEDTPDAAPGDGICADEFEACSLRAAIMEANATPGVQKIVIPEGQYEIAFDNVPSGDEQSGYNINSDLILEGAGLDKTIIMGTSSSRVFWIEEHATVTMSDLQITGGYLVGYSKRGYGGGISNSGDLTLARVSIYGNQIQAQGGGIYNDGYLKVLDSIIDNNDTTDGNASGGGGIATVGSLYMGGTTVSNNRSFAGSGISIGADSTTTILNSTIRDNRGIVGVGIYNSGITTMNNTIIDGNSASGSGGAVSNSSKGQLTISDSEMTNNTAAEYGAAINVSFGYSTGSVLIENSTIVGNHAGESGGVMYVDEDTTIDSITLRHNAMTYNTAESGMANIESLAQGTTISAQGNYWGEDPYLDGTIGGDVRYIPWYADEAMTQTVGPNWALSSLAISQAQFDFSYDIWEYSLDVNGDTEEIEVTATLFDFSSNLKIGDQDANSGVPVLVPLDRGANYIEITVTPAQQQGQPIIYMLVIFRPFEAAKYIVTTTGDTVDVNVGDGICSDENGQCSLRAAIMEANESELTDEIYIPAGTYELTIEKNDIEDDYDAAVGDLDILQPMIIHGDGPEQTIIDAGGIDRIFQVMENGSLDLTGVTITGGYTAEEGGGILFDSYYEGEGVEQEQTNSITNVVIKGNHAEYSGGGIAINNGKLSLQDVTLEQNHAFYDGGGLKLVDAHLTANDVVIQGNSTDGGGGGIDIYYSYAELSRVRITNNTAQYNGGGIYNSGYNDNELIITESDISHNQAEQGGGIYNNGTMTIEQTTISHNISQMSGGGITNYDSAEIRNSTIGQNTAGVAGGGFFSSGELFLSYTTISGNNLDIIDNEYAVIGEGSGLYIDSYYGEGQGEQGSPVGVPLTVIANSIIAGNHSTNDPKHDCSGTASLQGNNIITNSLCENIGEETALMDSDPLLGELADNGGFAPTFALLPGSPAIDAAIESNNMGASLDQRGILRPQGYASDIGAVEMMVEQTLETTIGFVDAQSIRYISSTTTVEQLRSALTPSAGGYVSIMNADHSDVPGFMRVNHGMIAIVTWPNQAYSEFSIHMIADELDRNEDERITIDEIVKYLVNSETRKDINFDDIVDETDILLLLQEIMPAIIEIEEFPPLI